MRVALHLVAGASLALHGTATAQVDSWQIPERGAVEYTRSTEQWSVSPQTDDARAGRRLLVRRGEQGGAVWQFRVGGAPGADGFERREFDASSWFQGHSPFGDHDQRSTWPADRPFLEARFTFGLPRRMPKAVVLCIDHDDTAVVWINGIPAYSGARFARGVYAPINEQALDALEPGPNLVAVRVQNTGGASYFDLAMTGYDRSFRDVEQPVRLTKALDDAAARIRNGLFPAFRAGPILCDGQLTRDRRQLTAPGIDFRDLPAFLGFDLERVDASGSTSGQAPRVYRFGDVIWRGKALPVDTSGLQRLEFDVKTGEPGYGRDDKRFVERYVRTANVYTHTFEGRFVIERRFDPERGVVTWMRTRIEGDVSALRGEDSGRASEFVLVEEWILKRVRKNRDGAFQDEVAAAIANGAKKLKAEIANPNKNVLKNERSGKNTYNSGRLALALLAIIHAGTPHDDPILVRGMHELRNRRFNDTYSTAHAIMAMEAWYSPRGEREELRAGLIDRPRQRQPSQTDKKLMEEWVATLLSNLDTRVDRGYLLRFNYTGAARYDHSVNQYGLLGLYSAMLCGVEVPATVWTSAANHLIADQEPSSHDIRLELTNYIQLERMRTGGTTTGPRIAGVAGWGYQAPKSQSVPNPIYGSMTCAGISGLTICLAGMRDAGLKRADLETSGERAIQRGFAWLADNFTLHSNPQRVHQPYHWVYYYLYGLERSCELSSIALINGRDWYWEGALTLLALQQDDGGWPDDHRSDEIMERTAMAVLFLKKSSAPVYTQR